MSGPNKVGILDEKQNAFTSSNRLPVDATLSAGNSILGKVKVVGDNGEGPLEPVSNGSSFINPGAGAVSYGVAKHSGSKHYAWVVSSAGAGSVDVSAGSSFTPGTGKNHLGKPEDGSHSTGDTGVMILGVRNDELVDKTGADGDYTAIATNPKGAVHTVPVDLNLEIARGNVPSVQVYEKFGKNPDIDTGSDPEDVWNGGGDYTGFDCTADEILTVTADGAGSLDTGTLLSSGTVDSATGTTITDTSATFVTDGVAVGDLIIDDTLGFHGYITGVTQTTITVDDFTEEFHADSEPHTPEIGDAYRVATAASTGAAVVRLARLLDSTYVNTVEYVILDNSTLVDTVGSYRRGSRAAVILCGTDGVANRDIVVAQKITTANILMVMPSDNNRTAIMADTVPAGKTLFLNRIFMSMARANGSPGSATMTLRARRFGSRCFETLLNPEISHSQNYVFPPTDGYIVLPEKTDYKIRVEAVSDNNTIVTAEVGGKMVDNPEEEGK